MVDNDTLQKFYHFLPIIDAKTFVVFGRKLDRPWLSPSGTA